MPAIKLLNIFALSTLAILLCTFAPSQTLAATIQPNHLAKRFADHHAIAHKKRGTKRCKPRSSSIPLSSTPAPKPTSTPPKENIVQGTSSLKKDPSPSSSSSPATPTKTPTGHGKLGVAWAMGNDKRFNLITQYGNVVIAHMWSADVADVVKNSGIPFSIMLWSDDQSKVNAFVGKAKPGYAKYAYGFNEVNEPSQANMGVDQAVSAWYKYLKPLAGQGYTLGGPVTTSAPNGFDWMTEFFQKCGGDCGVSEVPVHYYDTTSKGFQTYINKWAGFNLPMRVTEYACQNFNGGAQPSVDQIRAFYTESMAFLEADSRVLSHAPFGYMDDMNNVNPNDKLFNGDQLSSLGTLLARGY